MHSKFYTRHLKSGARLPSLCLAAFIISVSSLVASVAAQEPYIVCFYSAETNIHNFSSLKVEFDTYFSQFGPYKFQPFDHRETFEEFVTARQNRLCLISSWHYQKLKDRIPMEPVLVGLSENKTTQRRILSVGKKITHLESLRNAKITSASSDAYSRTILQGMFNNKHSDLVESIEIFNVPKDIDALLAVGFGISAAALTTECSLNKLSKINPKQYHSLRQLAISEEILRPLVTVSGDADKNIQILVKIIEEMGNKAEGENRLRMLGLDGLKKLSDKDKGMLKQ